MNLRSRGSPIVPKFANEILGPLGVPIVYGAPIGHTKRPMLTIPLGVRAKFHAKGEGRWKFWSRPSSLK